MGLRRRVRTEGGEALPVNEIEIRSVVEDETRQAGVVAAGWYALWTRSHCEQLVHDQLAAKGFELFLPEVDIWSSRAGVRRLISTPMFRGYLFVRSAMDKSGYIDGLYKSTAQR